MILAGVTLQVSYSPGNVMLQNYSLITCVLEAQQVPFAVFSQPVFTHTNAHRKTPLETPIISFYVFTACLRHAE